MARHELKANREKRQESRTFGSYSSHVARYDQTYSQVSKSHEATMKECGDDRHARWIAMVEMKRRAALPNSDSGSGIVCPKIRDETQTRLVLMQRL